jgi:hypothetical protein
MKTAADIYDEIKAYAEHAMLGMPPETPAHAILMMQTTTVSSAIVQIAAAMLRAKEYALACDLILLADRDVTLSTNMIASSDGIEEHVRTVLFRANARARANGVVSFMDPETIVSSIRSRR